MNVSPHSIKFFEENGGITLWHKLQQDLLLPTSLNSGEKNGKWDLIKCKSFYIAKETIYKTKRLPSEWHKTFANKATDKGLISKIQEEFMQLNIEKHNQNVWKT